VRVVLGVRYMPGVNRSGAKVVHGTSITQTSVRFSRAGLEIF
jgi:hypothetical protein